MTEVAVVFADLTGSTGVFESLGNAKATQAITRLSDLSGPDQILGTDTVINQLPPDSLERFRSLGLMDIRGRNEACMVYRVEWQETQT